MAKAKTQKTVAFLYGFTEGEWHGKRFRRMLRERGYTVIKDVKEANIIIAHSGGCFDIPELKKHSLLVMIDPPYWPEKPISDRARAMTMQLAKAIRPGNKPFYHTHKTARNLGYLVRHARTNRAMMSNANSFNLEQALSHPKTVLIRNSNDPWLTPDLAGLKQIQPKLKIVRVTGDHDDCWQHPERYLNLLQS